MVGTDFDNLADHVVSRRVELGLEREDVGRRMGMAAKTVERIELGKSVRRETLAALERALEWQAGSARRALEGGAPTVKTDEPTIAVDEQQGQTPRDIGQLTADEQRVMDTLVALEMDPAAIAQALREYRQRKAAKRSDTPLLQESESDTK